VRCADRKNLNYLAFPGKTAIKRHAMPKSDAFMRVGPQVREPGRLTESDLRTERRRRERNTPAEKDAGYRTATNNGISLYIVGLKRGVEGRRGKKN